MSLEQRVDRMDQRFDRLEQTIDRLVTKVDQGFDQVNKRFEQVDKRFDQVDKRFEQVDKRFEQVDKRFDQMDGQFDAISMTLLNHTERLDRIEENMVTKDDLQATNAAVEGLATQVKKFEQEQAAHTSWLQRLESREAAT